MSESEELTAEPLCLTGMKGMKVINHATFFL